MRTFALALLVGCTAVQDDDIGDTGLATDTGTADTGSGTFPQITGGDSASAQFALDYDALDDEDGDGRWEIGESATLSVTMTNTGADDFAYPGCELLSDDLASGAGEWPFFGIAAGESNTCTWTMEHVATAQAGDIVEVEVIADRLHCEDNGDCPEENPLVIRFRLVAAD